MKLMAICEAFADVIKRLMNSIMTTQTKDRQEKQKGGRVKSRQSEKVIKRKGNEIIENYFVCF